MFISEPIKAPSESARLYKLRYPVLVSRKLDGIRCLLINGKVLSRTLKEIPNNHIRHSLQAVVEKHGLCKAGDWDGELLTFDSNNQVESYNTIQSKVMSEEGKPNFKYFLFDYVPALRIPFAIRYSNLLMQYVAGDANGISQYDFIQVLHHKECTSQQQLEKLEQEAIDLGFEGLMIRDPLGYYLCKRCTHNEGALLKLKRFEDSEATIIGMEELMTNCNEAELDEFGRTKRSKCLAGLQPANTMGKLIVKDIHHPDWPSFEIGTGFTGAMRYDMWKDKATYCNGTHIIKYKYQKFGMKYSPRCPVFLGFRNKKDL